jgi:hypothetical protein
MELLLEALLQFFGELLLQVLMEIALELGFSRFRPVTHLPMHPLFAICGFFAWGLLAGALSLWPFPHSFITNHSLRLINLACTPLCAGGIMTLLGKWKEGRGKPLVRLDRFGYAFAFAFGMALVRFNFAK